MRHTCENKCGRGAMPPKRKAKKVEGINKTSEPQGSCVRLYYITRLLTYMSERLRKEDKRHSSVGEEVLLTHPVTYSRGLKPTLLWKQGLQRKYSIWGMVGYSVLNSFPLV